nr:hypothetical protein [Hepelivirales sp.]
MCHKERVINHTLSPTYECVKHIIIYFNIIYTKQFNPQRMNGTNDINIKPEEISDNAIAKVRNTEIHADTPSGAAWARKYEHPPAPTPVDYCGIPDENNSPSCHAEYKSVQQVQTYTLLPEPTTFNKVLLLHIASACAPVITFKYDTGGTRAQLAEDVILNPTINVQDMVAHAASGRIPYKSTTSNLNATDFSNQGVVTSALFRPNVTLYRAGDIIEKVAKSKCREKVIRSLHEFFVKNDEDIVVIPKGKNEIDFLIEDLGAAVDNFVQVANVGAIPRQSTDVVMLSPNSVSEVAKEGSFVVQRFSQPVQMYKDFAQNGYNGAGVSTAVGMPCYIQEFSSVDGFIFEIDPIRVNGQTGNATTTLADLPWTDMMWAWTLYEGLSVTPAATPSTGITPPYITIKCITGLEFQPLPNSVLLPFVKNSAQPDYKALQFASHVTHGRVDSLPSRYNFWGSLGKILLQAAPTVIDTISSIFGNKRSDEQKKTTNDTVKQLTAKINQMQSKLSKGPANQNTSKGQPLATYTKQARQQKPKPTYRRPAGPPTYKQVAKQYRKQGVLAVPRRGPPHKRKPL